MIRDTFYSIKQVIITGNFVEIKLFSLLAEAEKCHAKCYHQNVFELNLRPRMPHVCGFLDFFSFSHFLATSCCF